MSDETRTFTFERLPTKYYPEKWFRPKTPYFEMDLNCIFVNGGMGDYVCWLTPIEWLASEAVWLRGHLIVPTYFKEIAQYFLRKYPRWTLQDYKDVPNIAGIDQRPFRGPMELPRESLNATGAHLLTCGWVYYTNKEGPPGPEWDRYPHFEQNDLDRLELPAAVRTLKPKQYAVITTGMTTNSRTPPKGAWNPVIEYVLEKGLTPVFLGKAVMDTGNATNIHTKFGEEIKFSLGIDLRDQTTLLQAASIMSRAAVVIGHDNGLLHLAGCTDVPIVFGYNLASPAHRKPRRPIGKIFDVLLEPGELNCYHCQSNFNFVLGYNFKNCMWGDNKCLTMLFDEGAARWKRQIDLALAPAL